MGIIKYTDRKHEYLRAKSQFYYKPNVKSLKYFAKILFNIKCITFTQIIILENEY